MMRPIFVLRFGVEAGCDDRARTGTAWFATPDQVVTCHHCIAIGAAWASLQFPAGEYALYAEDGALVARLTPGIALREADVAVLHPDSAMTPPQPLEVAAGYICESSPWHADGYPAVAGQGGFRLSGAITRIGSAAGPRQMQLSVVQGTDVDWARASGTPIARDGDEGIVGMLTGQFDGANTCFALGAHAISVALWADRCVRALDASELPAVALAVGAGSDEHGDERPEDVIARVLAADTVRADDWRRALDNARVAPSDRERFVGEVLTRPEAPPESAEDDLRRRALRQLDALQAPTSNQLLALYFGTEGAAESVFVPPQLLRPATAQRAQEGAGSSAQPESRSVVGRRTAKGASTSASDALAEATETSERAPSTSYAELLRLVAESHSGAARRLVILGEAGSGKTTLLHRLARDILHADLGYAVLLRYEEVQARPLRAHLQGDWLLRQEIRATDAACYAAAIDRLYAKGRLWLLVDGVDEADAGSRKPLDHLWRELTAHLPKAHAVVACRQSYWYQGLNQLYAFTVLEMEQFTLTQLRAAAGMWLSGLADRGARFLSVLDEPGNEYLLESARNPLRLAMLCALWRWHARTADGVEQALPRTRSALYEQFVALFQDWNAPRLRAGSRHRADLLAALETVALASLQRSGAGAEIDESLLQPALRRAASVDIDDLTEAGWLVSLSSSDPNRKTYRFNHRTFLEYFAARAVPGSGFLFDPSAAAGGFKALDPRWREVCLFWMGRSDEGAPNVEKDRLLDRLLDFRDKSDGFYRSRAHHLAAACLREHPAYPRDLELVALLLGRAVAQRDDSGRWHRFLAPVSDAALDALRHVPAERVREVAQQLLLELDDDGAISPWIAASLCQVFAACAGTDEKTGRQVGHMLIEWEAAFDAGSMGGLFRNEGFVARLRQGLRRNGRVRERVIELLGESGECGPVPARLLFEALRRARTVAAREKLLRAIARQKEATPGDVDLLRRRGFAQATASKDLYLLAWSSLTRSREHTSAQLFAAARDAACGSDRALYVSRLASLTWTDPDFPVDPEAVAHILDNLDFWTAACPLPDLMAVAAQGCMRDPALPSRYVAMLQPLSDPDPVWRLLRYLERVPRLPASVQEPLAALAQHFDHDMVRYFVAKLLLKVEGVDRAPIVEALAALVARYGDPIAQGLETPYLAGQLLRELEQAPAHLIESLLTGLRRPVDAQAQRSALSCLALVGKGSITAARAVAELLGRDCGGNLVFHYTRALRGMEVPAGGIAAGIVRALQGCDDASSARWILECMLALRIGGEGAFARAQRIALQWRSDESAVQAALEYLAMRTDRRAEVLQLAFDLAQDPSAAVRMRAFVCLGEIGHGDAAVLPWIAERIATETDGSAFQAASEALQRLCDDPAQVLKALPGLRRAWDSDLAVDNRRDWRRSAALEVLRAVSESVDYETFLHGWQAAGPPPSDASPASAASTPGAA
jgi:hypothetical protein